MSEAEGPDRKGARGVARALLVPSSDGLRRNNFDAIRLGMALLVVWSHSFALFIGSERGEPLSLATNGFYNAGNIGVLTFFTISGFLITLSFERSKSIASYFKRRIARIHPGYLVAITLCSLLVVPALTERPWGVLDLPEAMGLASNVLLRDYIVPPDPFSGAVLVERLSVNGSLWSIPYEFWCYIGVALLGIAGVLRRRWSVVILTGAVMAVRAWLDWTGRHPGGGVVQTIIGPQYLWFTVLPPFLLGAVLYLYRDRVPRRRWIAVTLTALTVIAAHAPVAPAWQALATRLLFPPALAYGTLYLAFSSRLRLHDAARYGDFSYGTYLYAFPIQRLIDAAWGDRLSFPALVALAMILSLAAGVASWYLVERWFLPRIRHGRMSQAGQPLQEEAALVAP